MSIQEEIVVIKARCYLLFILVCFAASCAATSSEPGGGSTGTTETSDTNTDSESNTDDITGQTYKFHAIYMLASDITDQELDTNGTIRGSIIQANNWLLEQSGSSTIRFLRDDDQIKVDRLRLTRTDAQMRVPGDGQPLDNLINQIEHELAANGFNSTDEFYMVWYQTNQTSDCGGRSIGRPGIGNTAFMEVCDTQGFIDAVANNSGTTTFNEYVMLHEMFHLLGAAPSCAPNYDVANDLQHTTNEKELMYSGSDLSRPWDPQFLDQGNDDYFGHSNDGCLDIADSAFLIPEPTAKGLPSGTPAVNRTYSIAEESGCSSESSTSSSGSAEGIESLVNFINMTGATLKLYWLNNNGDRVFREDIEAYLDTREFSVEGNNWLLTDASGNCKLIYPTTQVDEMITLLP